MSCAFGSTGCLVGQGQGSALDSARLSATQAAPNVIQSELEPTTFYQPNTVGRPQEYRVPEGVTRLRATVIGGPGAHGEGFGGGRGADGTRVEAELPVTPGQVLYVVVGGAGGSEVFGRAEGGGERGGRGGGGGGGASSIFTCPPIYFSPCPAAEASELLVGGGGGGGGEGTEGSSGGAGGGAGSNGSGATGQPGEAVLDGAPGGGGGGATLSDGGEAGAMAGLCNGGELAGSGKPGRGGSGGEYDTGGGGGGGGWYGGGGGGGGGKTACGSPTGGGGGGGGGSSYGPPGTIFAQDATGVAMVEMAPLQPLPPIAETEAAGPPSETSATLNGVVNPEGDAITDCHFEYGVTSASGASVPCASLPGAGNEPVPVSAAISGLTPGTKYHFRIVTTNVAATAEGTERAFTTLSPTGPPPPAIICARASLAAERAAQAMRLEPAAGASIAAGTPVAFSGESNEALTFSVASSQALLYSPDIDIGLGLQSGAFYKWTSPKAAATPGTIFWAASFTFTPEGCKIPATFTTSVRTLAVTPTETELTAKTRQKQEAEVKKREEAAAGRIVLDGLKIRVQNNREATIELTCADIEACDGKLVLTVASKPSIGEARHTRPETIGTASFSIVAREKATIRIALGRTGRKLLSAAHGPLSATLTVVRTAPLPNKTQTRHVHLEPQKATKHRAS